MHAIRRSGLVSLHAAGAGRIEKRAVQRRRPRQFGRNARTSRDRRGSALGPRRNLAALKSPLPRCMAAIAVMVARGAANCRARPCYTSCAASGAAATGGSSCVSHRSRTARLIAGIAPLLGEDGHPDVLKGPNDAKWGAAPPALPKGVQLTVSSGDPAKNGPFVVRLNLPANNKGHSRV